MTTDRTRLPSGVELATIDPGTGRRPPRQVSQEYAAATAARIIQDEHRSDNGRCPRCDVPWPCSITAAMRNGIAL